MNYLNSETRILHAPEYIGCDPTARATWFSVSLWCAQQENGGRIAGGLVWNSRRWQQTCGVTLREIVAAKSLLIPDGEDLVVWQYPLQQELEVKAKREAGKLTAAKRWAQHTSSADSSATSSVYTKGKGIEKERKGIKTVGALGSPATPSPRAASTISNDEWMQALRTNPAYVGIDVDREAGKARAWAAENKKQMTRRRFINWLNRCERPLGTFTLPPKRNADEPKGWLEYLSRTYPDSPLVQPGERQVQKWSDLDRINQEKILREMKNEPLNDD